MLIVISDSFTSAAESSAVVSQQPGQKNRKKVFLTDGKTVELTGLCVFFTRSNNAKPVTSENIHRVSPLLMLVHFCNYYLSNTHPVCSKTHKLLQKLVRCVITHVLYIFPIFASCRIFHHKLWLDKERTSLFLSLFVLNCLTNCVNA